MVQSGINLADSRCNSLEAPLVTVVMPAYNSERFIAESIQSVLDQRFKSWELIIVDDNSRDNTVPIVQGFVQNDQRIRIIQLASNRGAAVARNVAIEAARGRYIAFLDSDDLWLPWKLEQQLQLIQKKKCILVYGSYYKIDESGSIIKQVVKAPNSVDYKKMLYSNYIGCLTAMYDTALMGKVLMPDIRRRQDYGLWLQLLRKGFCAIGTSQPMAIYRQRSGDSLSSNRVRNIAYNWILYRKVENLGILKSVICLGSCALNRLLKP